MDLKAKKPFSSNLVGNVSAGQILRDVSERYAAHLCDAGLAEPVGGPKQSGPFPDGTAKPSSSSQAGQASKPRSLITSESVMPPARAESSQSTQPQSTTDEPTQSTLTTGSGGSTTKKGRGRPRKRKE